MGDWTHFIVLTKKNFITLKRNLGFAICFILLPLITMGIFALLLGLIGSGYQDPQNNYNQLFWTTTSAPIPIGQFEFADVPTINNLTLSSLLNCKAMSLTNYSIVGDSDSLQYFAAINKTLQSDPFNFHTQEYNNTDEVNEIVRNEDSDTFCFSIQVDKLDVINDVYEFHVSWLRNNIPDTNQAPYDVQIKTPDYQNWNKTRKNGFLGIYFILVSAIQTAKIANGFTDNPLPLNIDMAYMPMKTPRYYNIDPQVTAQLAIQFPFFMMFTFLIPLYYMVSKLAEEKESKSREGMKMMGLKDFTYFLSWMFTFTTIIFIMSLLLTVMVSFNTFTQSNKLLFFLFNFIYGISLFGFSVMIVAVLPTQRSSSLAASLLHVITYFIVYAIQSPDIDPAVKIALSIFPNVGMSLGFTNLFHFEFQSNGLGFPECSTWYGNYTFTAGILMLLFDSFFYLFFGLYLDAVIPSQYGVAKKWYFVCTRNFWCGGQRRRDRIRSVEHVDRLLEDDYEARNPNDFEQVASNVKKQEETNECLKIRGLRKEFGDKIAVDNTDITMYQGQIFALLGHNGAGKTTTISMLTGLFEPTKGTASVYGINIFDEMEEMRKILGVCPQHDVLFDYLTPREHLMLFAAFKQTPRDQIDAQIEKMIKDIDLVSVKDQIAKTLSGGQKRKLSVGCAMIGNSKVVILDEPSSGMDTTSRRRLWEMLKQNKSDKIIILTTHYMDEADILGDRIGIMAEGKVKCCGSSLFLKNRYGVGYNLVIAKKTREPAPHIDEFIFTRINDVKKLQEVSSEMNFQLPTASSSQFKDFFDVFDKNLDALGIRSYGVGITTLEEVFLKIGRGSEEDDEEEKEELRRFTLAKKEDQQRRASKIQVVSPDSSLNRNSNSIEEYSIADEHEVGYLNVFLLNLGALLKKKFYLQIREPKTFLIEILFPIIFIFAGLALSSVQIFREGHPVELTPTMFPLPNNVYYNTDTLQFAGTKTFVEKEFQSNLWVNPGNTTQVWSEQLTQFQIDNTQGFQSMVQSLDNQMYDAAMSKGQILFGNYFYYQSNQDKSVILVDPTSQLKLTPACQYSAVALINATSQDALPVFAHVIHEAILRDYYKNPNLAFNVYMTPFPVTALEEGVLSAAAGTTSSILFAIAYMMVSNSLIQNIIGERKRNVKHQMVISGVSIPAYWLSHYIVDLAFQAIPSLFIILGINLFNLDMPQTWVVVLIFIFANPVFVYCISFLFENEGTASILTRLIYLLAGSILPIAVSVLQVFPTTSAYGKVLRWFFYILPIFALNFGVINIANRKIMALVEKRSTLLSLDPLVAGPSVYFLIADIAFYWVIITLFENGVFSQIMERINQRRRRGQEDLSELNENNEDEDVMEEERRVQSVDPATCTVMLNKVKKVYGKSLAVDKVSFGLEYGECFALLGVSGAGKTTSFKCLTGEVKPTEGTVMVNGFDVTSKEGFDQARRLIGYCPQFDAIFDGLTVREHLEFYAKVKGVVRRFRAEIVNKQMNEMDLMEFENVRAEKLSGGNKRKLSVAMAMIGNPPIVFLDEPSTGVDPKAKRFMWSIVSKISTQRKKSSVIITTHSMEEAEALCTKMGIMVAGKFKCFGSSQHIKDKFGTGYEIEIKIRTLTSQEINAYKQRIGIEEQPLTQNLIETVLNGMDYGNLINEIKEGGLGDDFWKELQQIGSIKYDELIKWAFTESKAMIVMELFQSMFVSVELLEHYYNSYLVKVSRDNYSIGFLFGMMEEQKANYEISEYSVSQTTLEQIFNNFAKDAEKNNPRRRTTLKKLTDGRASQNQTDADILRLKTERLQTVALDKSNEQQ